ncbi:MAG TPA: hypothetical protein VFS24_13020 [Steroidobacteraceae bacterium]|nr:hypothetical protein [Steroidobacteraceae bacterium]
MKTLHLMIAGLLLASASAASDAPPPIQARWQPREIQATFSGLRTAYNCDAVELRIRRMLLALGAHPKTSVLVTGCAVQRLASTFFIHIATATSVPIDQPGESDAKQELLRRLGSKNAYGAEEFPAVWKTADLTRIKGLHFEPGDCELLQVIQEQVLPKLGAEVPKKRLQCAPGSSLVRLPALTVTMLAPAPAPDAPKP